MEDYAGWITIGTKVDTKGLKQGLTETKRELQKRKKEDEKLEERKIKLELDTKKFEEDYNKELERLKKLRDKAPKNSQLYKSYQSQIDFVGDINSPDYLKAKEELNKINELKKENNKEQERLNGKIKDYTNELKKAKNLEESKKGLAEHEKGIGNIIRKVIKWGLAVFSVRSMYMLIRRSVSTLSQYNEQLAADLQYINYAIAKVLEPAIERLVQLVYTFLSYINEIAKGWFNINLFSRSSAKSFKNAIGSAKELKKILTSFDEANTVSSSSSSGVSAPSFDLGKGLTEEEKPGWLSWIIDNKDIILSTLAAIGLFVVGFKASKIMAELATLFGTSGTGVGLIRLLEILGILAGIGVIVIEIKCIYDGVLELIKTLGINNQLLNKNFESSANLAKQYQQLSDENKLTSEQLDKYNNYLAKGAEENSIMIDGLKNQKNWLTELTGTNRKLDDQINTLLDTMALEISNYENLYNQGKLNESQQKDYKKALEKTIETFQENGRNADELKEAYKRLTGENYSTTITVTAKADTGQAEKDYSSFFSKLGATVSTILSPKEWGDGFFSKIKNFWAATGAIINLPGKGVPIGYNVRGGEAGAEGVIPLTDSQAMEQLGSVIGRYVTINLTANTNLDGRTIARNQSVVKSDQDFMLNR